MLAAVQRIEIGNAIDAEHYGLTVDHELLHPVLAYRLDDPWDALGPIVAEGSERKGCEGSSTNGPIEVNGGWCRQDRDIADFSTFISSILFQSSINYAAARSSFSARLSACSRKRRTRSEAVHHHLIAVSLVLKQLRYCIIGVMSRVDTFCISFS